MNSPISLMIHIHIVKRKEIKMKYVTLEHKLAMTCYPRVNFDTNDAALETEIYEIKHQRYAEQENAKSQIRNEIDQVMDTERQTKKELDELRSKTPILKRFSNEYRTERDRLQKQYQDCQIRNSKLFKEAERLEEDVLAPFNNYNKLKELLKKQGYALVNKTTNDNHVTTEIWHKN